ncbi:hypothetical protein GCM10022254_67270 [Actinomadura meridiana]|uniref:Tetratricopeptide repeat protein n=1 Tax=Actinomadura meridiana TaxID=559626 RepID=A0ABP8CLL2_9ACTN
MRRLPEALPLTRQALDIFRDLEVARPTAYTAAYTQTAATLGYGLVQAGLWEDATAALAEAWTVGRELPEHNRNILGLITRMLRRCHAEDAAGTASAFRAVTGLDVPGWMKEPPSGPPG